MNALHLKGPRGAFNVCKQVMITERFKKFFCFFLKLFINLFCVLFLCEFLIYYVVIFQCNWKKLEHESVEDGLKTMILADTHMLGPFRGHPFDRLRREWQMKRSFQAAIQLFKPDVVLLLGDVFDEGNWVNDRGFAEYVDRFNSIFYVPPTTRLHAIHGNHDINFHYAMHPHLINRFNRAFNTSGVRLIREKKETSKGLVRKVNFVSINSMAMERDGCNLCLDAEFNINTIEKKLNQLKKKNLYSPPILLQHFPTYRQSDDECLEKNSLNNDKYREKHDTLSKDSSEFIHRTLGPRLYFSGHSHHYCKTKNSIGAFEYTLASFNWRNINNPSFLLALFTPDDYSVSKCDMPKETTVIALYVIGAVLSIIFAIVKLKSIENLFKRRVIKKEV